MLWMLLVAALLAAPILPSEAVEITTEYGSCPGGVTGWRTFYDLDGDPSEAEIITYGRAGRAQALLVVYFTPGKPTADQMVLTLPGQPARVITGAALDEEFGGLCGLFASDGHQSG